MLPANTKEPCSRKGGGRAMFPPPGQLALDPASARTGNSLPRKCELLRVTHSSLLLIVPSRLNLILMSIKGGPKSAPSTWLLGSVLEEPGPGSLISEIPGGRCPSSCPRLLPGHTAFTGWLGAADGAPKASRHCPLRCWTAPHGEESVSTRSAPLSVLTYRLPRAL